MLKRVPLLTFEIGIKLYRPEHQQTLSEDISRVVDQFSADAFSQLKQSLNCSPVNVLEFLDITKTKIKPTIDNLYELLPTTRHLLEDFDESEPQRGEEIEFDRDRPSNSERCLLKVHQRIGRPHAFLTPASATSSTSHGAKNSRGRHANPSKSSTKQSSGSTDSPSIPSLFSDNGIHGSVHPPTNTITSTSPSEVGNTNSEPTNSDSIGSPLSCKKYRPFLKLSQRIKRPRAFFTPASASSSTEHGVNNSRRPHINPSKSRTKQSSGSTDSPSISSLFSNNDIHNCVHPSITTITSFSTSKVENSEPGQLVRVDPDQLVRVWSRNGRNYKTCIVLIDTGADENFIRRSVVRELDIVIQKSPILLGLETLGSHKFKVGEYVRPTWQFEDERKQHQNDSFSILTEMPDDIDMVLGRLASQDLDIQLFKPRRALVAYEDWQGSFYPFSSRMSGLISNVTACIGLSTQEREKQQLERQTRDGDASRAKMRQELAARRAHLRRKRDAENAPKKMKPEDSTSKKDATGSADDHV